MDAHELEYVSKHLGHTMNVDENDYKSASGSIERIQVGKLMLIAERNLISQCRGQRLKDLYVQGNYYFFFFNFIFLRVSKSNHIIVIFLMFPSH